MNGVPAMAPVEARALVRRALNGLTVTESTFWDYDHGRPLVEDILAALLTQIGQGDQVLLIGGNKLLAHCIRSAGFGLHWWRLEPHPEPIDPATDAQGTISVTTLGQKHLPFQSTSYAAVVLPLVIELLPFPPSRLLGALRHHLHPAGVIVIASRNLAASGLRRRAVFGQSHVPPGTRAAAIGGGWPVPPEQRYYLRTELIDEGRVAGLRLVASLYSLGTTTIHGGAGDRTGRYLGRLLVRAQQRCMPAWRDYQILTLDQPVSGGQHTAALPMVSVVLPTHNRSALLRDSFAGLLLQTYPMDRFEVVIINDNSTDDTAEVAANLAREAPFTVRYEKTSGLGATAARNLGMHLARGDIVAHLDDDNRPVPEWLEEAALAFGKDVAVVGGPVVPKPEQHIPFFSFTAYYEREQGIFPTSNIFYRRDIALAAGGFDESFGRSLMGRPVWGWDSDLGWRLLRAGYRSRFRPGAVAYQEVVAQKPRAWLLDCWRMVVLPTTIKRVPELGMTLLVGRLFVSTSSLYFQLLLAGTVLALLRRRLAPLALAVPYALHIAQLGRQDCWPPARWPAMVAKLGLAVARQGITLTALLVGSAQAKRLVL